MDRTHISKAVATMVPAGTPIRTLTEDVKSGANPIHDKMVQFGVVPATAEMPATDTNPVEAPAPHLSRTAAATSVDRPRGRRKEAPTA